MEGLRGLKDALRLCVKHFDYERLKKIQDQINRFFTVKFRINSQKNKVFKTYLAFLVFKIYKIKISNK